MRSEEISFQSSSRIQSEQETKLVELLTYLHQHSPFYQNHFKQHSIEISGIRKIEDLVSIPPTTKEDLQQYNNDFLCVDSSKIIEYTSTSGTLGSPVTIALTEKDLNRLAYNEYQSFVTAGGSPTDIYQLMLTLDRQFMAGIAYYSGIRRLGAGIIRLGPGVPSLQWETIKKLKPTAIVAVPSFILKLTQYVSSLGEEINQSSVRKAICIGENIRHADCTLNTLGNKIKEAWDIQLFSTYASTEMQTAFTECEQGRGGHLLPELVIVEVLDEQDQPVAPNVAGEITITTLGVEGMPLLRYKTGDVCLYYNETCGCGRNTIRLSPVIGRKKQMIKFKGTTLYPSALFDLLNEMNEVVDYVIEVTTDEVDLDKILLYLLPIEKTEEVDHKIRAYLQARLRVTPLIRYISLEEIQRLQVSEASRKLVRFIDRRN